MSLANWLCSSRFRRLVRPANRRVHTPALSSINRIVKEHPECAPPHIDNIAPVFLASGIFSKILVPVLRYNPTWPRTADRRSLSRPTVIQVADFLPAWWTDAGGDGFSVNPEFELLPHVIKRMPRTTDSSMRRQDLRCLSRSSLAALMDPRVHALLLANGCDFEGVNG